MVKIRLAQTGSTNRKAYRVIVIEEGKRRNGKALEIVGYINPLIKPPKVDLKRDRVDFWLSRGAQLSPAVKELLSEAKK